MKVNKKHGLLHGFPGDHHTSAWRESAVGFGPHRKDFLHGAILVGGGPGQRFSHAGLPTDWPKTGTLLRIPKLVSIDNIAASYLVTDSWNDTLNEMRNHYKSKIELFIEHNIEMSVYFPFWAEMLGFGPNQPGEQTPFFGTNVLYLQINNTTNGSPLDATRDQDLGFLAEAYPWYPSFRTHVWTDHATAEDFDATAYEPAVWEDIPADAAELSSLYDVAYHGEIESLSLSPEFFYPLIDDFFGWT